MVNQVNGITTAVVLKVEYDFDNDDLTEDIYVYNNKAIGPWKRILRYLDDTSIYFKQDIANAFNSHNLNQEENLNTSEELASAGFSRYSQIGRASCRERVYVLV